MHVGRRKEDDERSGSSTAADFRSTVDRHQLLVRGIGGVVVAALVMGWLWVLMTQRTRTAAAAEPTSIARAAAGATNGASPTAVYVTDVAMRAFSGELRGASGKLRARIRPAGTRLSGDSTSRGLVVLTE